MLHYLDLKATFAIEIGDASIMTDNPRDPRFYAMELHGVLTGVENAPAPRALSMRARRYFPPLACIYCQAAQGTTDEHIIPKALGGNLLFPKASCVKCQACINKVETYCIDANFQFGRAHLGIFGTKSRRKPRTRIRSAPHVDGEFRGASLPIEEHPGALILTTYMPGLQILFNQSPNDIEHTTVIIFVNKDYPRRLSGKGVVQLGGSHPITFGRFLAKIAHGFASAELANVAWRPLLTKFILGEDERHPAYWIGTELVERAPTNQLHEIELTPQHTLDRNSRYIVVSLRLFSSLEGSQTYSVVVGERIKRSELQNRL